MEITREQLEQLARIYNTFMNIELKGENIFIMSDCLRALEKVITDIDNNATREDTDVSMNAVEEG